MDIDFFILGPLQALPQGVTLSVELVTGTTGFLIRSRLKAYSEAFVALFGVESLWGTNALRFPRRQFESGSCAIEAPKHTYSSPRAPWLQMTITSEERFIYAIR